MYGSLVSYLENELGYREQAAYITQEELASNKPLTGSEKATFKEMFEKDNWLDTPAKIAEVFKLVPRAYRWLAPKLIVDPGAYADLNEEQQIEVDAEYDAARKE
jgi:hypothetical protein